MTSAQNLHPTKPCERSACPNLIARAKLTPSLYAKRRFCSNRCAALERYAYGAKPPRPSHAQAVASGQRGGRTTGERKRKAAALRAVEALEPLITPDLRHAVGVVRLKALLVRAFHVGHVLGKSAARMKKQEAA